MSNINLLTVNNNFLVVNNQILILSSGSSGGGGIVPSGLSNILALTHGQSNAGFFDITDGASTLAAQCISYWLGGTGTPGSPDSTLSGNTTQAGVGVYCGVTGYGSYLSYTADTVQAASSAVYTSNGYNMLNSINTLTTQQKANIQIIILDHGETDSLFAGTGYAGNGGLGYNDKAVYKAAVLNNLNQIRAALNKIAAQLPVLVFGVTYGTFQGYAMVREAWAELAANSANNIVWGIRQTGDDVVRGNNYNSSTGLITVGTPNSGHVDTNTNLIFAARLSLAAARIIQSSNNQTPSNIPLILGNGVGPQIVSATLSGNTSAVTIQHDAGNDLIVPLLASYGVGWTLMDGGTISSPGNLINATACVRVDSTHLQITWASTPVNSGSNCRLFYPIQSAPSNSNQPLQLIGRGCAVTDNFSRIMSQNNINFESVFNNYLVQTATDIETQWNGNFPICSPVTQTGSGSTASVTFGISL